MASQMFGRLRTQAALLQFCGLNDSTVQDAAEEAAKLLPSRWVLLLRDKLISLQVPTEIIRIIVVIVV